MNKKIFTGAGIVVFILLSIGGFFFWKLYSDQTPKMVIIPAEENTNNYPVLPTTTVNKTPEQIVIPKEGNILIQTKDNENISIKDFTKSKKTTIYKEWGATLKTHPFYTVLYFTIDQSFLISLKGGDLPIVRIDAEKELLADIGLTEDEACQLNVATTVACNVNQKACGTDYGLSFCPSGKQLPKNL